MAETMVERIAKALAATRYAHCGGADAETLVSGKPNWTFCLRDALTALKAMKHPPPSIKARGAKALFNNQDLAHEAWEQMIDQAIKEGGDAG